MPLTSHQDPSFGIIIHRNFKPLFVNDDYAHIFGFNSAEEVMALSSIFELIDPTFHEVAQDNYNDLIQGGKIPKTPTIRSFINQDKDGRLLSIIAFDNLIEWEGEPAVQVNVINIDMLDHEHTKLLKQEQKYKDLFWNSTQGFIVHRNFKLLMVNPAFAKMIKADSIAQLMAMDSLKCIITQDGLEFAIEQNRKLMNNEISDSDVVIANIDFEGNIKYFHILESKIDWDGEPAIQISLIDVTETHLLEKKIRYQACHDPLTDVLNRRGILNIVEDKQSQHEQIACLLLDLDDFKNINDQYSHSAGDFVLKEFAKLCSSLLPSSAYLGRWGGEEFIIFNTIEKPEDAFSMAETIRNHCENHAFTYQNQPLKITVSIGVSISATLPHNIDKMISQADKNMYLAKNAGKNKYLANHNDK
ncbi:sensor domain-containing diguanylate cyclase [Vibrio sp. 10N.286.49.B3]|uniref:sensor domain-containing diguanylate cyclase n=1 Tax=Vibrio sp. 10N.286.49.B3 TaxID=1880855 RepID=UPI000C852558|nr:sensor domain-containing diguanylate cyclase [Vibrio sp. 10N.286.49.B3]